MTNAKHNDATANWRAHAEGAAQVLVVSPLGGAGAGPPEGGTTNRDSAKAGMMPVETLRGEILADARREAAEILQRARATAEALLATAQAEADESRNARLTLAHSEAGHRREMLLATIPTETERLRSAAIERLLQSIRAEAQQRLVAREGFDYPGALVGLAAEAISGMVGTAFVVKLAAADYAAFGKALTMKLSQQLARSSLSITVAGDPAMAGDGVIIQNAEGYQVWDNRFEARLERLWPELRRQIAVQTSLVAASNPTGGGA